MKGRELDGLLSKLHPRVVSRQLSVFLEDEAIGGRLIIVFAILSLIIVNSPLGNVFSDFWHTTLSIGVGQWAITMDLRHWVNEGLMAFFFLVVGLEIKRELVKGELRDRRTALLPIGAAVGGMLVPALIYLAFNFNTDAIRGWGIPMATDIAFAVAVLALLSKRVPSGLKIFLLSLAIADDIGAIAVIALFYTQTVHLGYLFAAGMLIVLTAFWRHYLGRHLLIVMVIGATLWLALHLAGVHASITGAIMGLLAPVGKTYFERTVAERAEKLFLPFTTFVVLPLFAFANAGFVIAPDIFAGGTSLALGIIFGLLVGKLAGIALGTWVLVRLGIARLPSNVGWRHIYGVGLLASIGFTISIFITELAFTGNADYIATAKASIFIASTIGAVAGYVVLRGTRRQQEI